MVTIPSPWLDFLRVRGVFLANHLASKDNLNRTTKRQNKYQRKLTIHKQFAVIFKVSNQLLRLLLVAILSTRKSKPLPKCYLGSSGSKGAYTEGISKIGERWGTAPCGRGVADLATAPHVLSCLIWWFYASRYQRYKGDPPENLISVVPISRSLKVIRTDTDRSAAWDFLLTFHSIHWPISCRFRDKWRLQSKIANVSDPVYFESRLKGFLLELGPGAWDQKLKKLVPWGTDGRLPLSDLDLDLGSGHTAYRRASLIDLYLRTKFH